jgi:hypothetical protein
MIEPASQQDQIERNQRRIAAGGMKQVVNGAIWLGAASASTLLFRFVRLHGPISVTAWVPLILRIVAEVMLVGGLLKLAEGPDRWRVRELAIFSGLGTLPRPLLWVLRMVLTMLRVDFGLATPLTALVILMDAAAFATIVYLFDRIETAETGRGDSTLGVAAYVASGLVALASVLEMASIVPYTVPLSTLAGAGLAVTVYLLARRLHARLAA